MFQCLLLSHLMWVGCEEGGGSGVALKTSPDINTNMVGVSMKRIYIIAKIAL